MQFINTEYQSIPMFYQDVTMKYHDFKKLEKWYIIIYKG